MTTSTPVELQWERPGTIDHTRRDPGPFRDRLLHRYETTVFPTVTVTRAPRRMRTAVEHRFKTHNDKELDNG
jgi:hypothetical protein